MDTQKQIVTAPPEGADNGNRIFCGKFASVGELEKAYDSLQSEFTRKCQRNAWLEKRFEESEAARGETGKDGKHTGEEGKDTPSTSVSGADGAVQARPSGRGGGGTVPALDDETRAQAIREFLSDLHRAKPPFTISAGGRINTVPPQKPASIAEAGRMVKGMLENGGFNQW